MQGKSAILIFAKLPRLNYVKTRLIGGNLDAIDVLQLYHAFLLDTISQGLESSAEKIFLSLTDMEQIPLKLSQISIFAKFHNNPKIHSEVHIQPEGTFGERMKHAVNWLISKDYTKIIVLGADSPQIQPFLLNQSFDLLDHNQVVLGPSPEGGIYLIGLNNIATLDGFEFVFDGVEFLSFIKFINQHHYSVKLIPELTDIDTQSDLVSLISWLTGITHILTKSSDLDVSIPTNTLDVIKTLRLSIEVDDSNNRQKQIIKSSRNMGTV